jgi:serine/threonine protein kinase
MASAPIGIGSEIGPFRILRLLGEGGVGRVYAALDTDLGRHVALKALRPELSNDASFVERFRGEAASLARLQHPNITTLYSLHRDGRDLFMVMELVRGYTLEEVLQKEKRLSAEAMRALAAQACAGLNYAHRMGVIHRDLKPSNLMFTESGLLKIMDFGIARVRGSERLTQVGSIVGTLAYMPPEQIKGADNDERSDIYSLGCVFYEVLCGSSPFRGKTEYEMIQAQIGDTPPALRERCADLEPAVDEALLRSLAKSPKDRFADSLAFGRALGTPNLTRDPQEIVRDVILSRMPALDSLDATMVAARPSKTPKGSSTAAQPDWRAVSPPKPERAPAKARPAWLPLVVLGGAALVVAGALGFVMLRPAPPSLPQTQVMQLPAETTDTQLAQTAPGLPANPNILPAPDSQGTATERIAAATQPNCAGGESGFVENHVDGVSNDGWPQVGGNDLHLFGVRELSSAAQSRLANWLAKKGDQIACCAMDGNAQLCRTAGAHHQDLSLYLLLNGLARADDTAPQAYQDAEAKAKSDRRGMWQ